MKNLILIAVLFGSASAFAQEHVGNGKYHSQPQQQQQQSAGETQLQVVRGTIAKDLYLGLKSVGNPEMDLSPACTEPVHRITGSYEGQDIVCYDRGNRFLRSRYKCFIDTGKPVQGLWKLFNADPNNCGGDGIREKRQ